ncbi:MAG: hypothetical protein HY735_30350 [Verrucomicrobia bacterium]|nr:hypothetical protein [Verrucomicrobiota bacterium]
MLDPALKAELLRSLGRLVKGLSALFWGLPLALLICVKTATSDWLKPLGIAPPLLANGLLFYGLWQLSHFQKQERVWNHALDRAKLLCIANIGLSPFVFWWNQVPQVPLFSLALGLLTLSSLLFLFNLNHVLQRLTAMLPDETLRHETNFFTSLNLYLLLALVALAAVLLTLEQINSLPVILIDFLKAFELVRQWVFVFLLLLPLAMTMTLIWKIKEAILTSAFEDRPPDHAAS